jgi:hypothetical protein
MPMPPSQWVVARHKSIECGNSSMSVTTVAPVVVKPDIVSKKASANVGRMPELTKGKAPMAADRTHPSVTKR